MSTPAVNPESAGWRRLHPLTPFLNGGFIFVVITGIFISNFRDTLFGPILRGLFGAPEQQQGSGRYDPADWVFSALSQSDNLLLRLLIPLLVLLGIVLIAVLFSWISWRFMRFQITSEAVELRRGVVFKKQSRAPLKRVQAIDIERRLLARVFGLAELNILNAGDTLKLAFVRYSEAKALRDEILQSVRIAKGSDPAATPATALGAEAVPGQGAVPGAVHGVVPGAEAVAGAGAVPGAGAALPGAVAGAGAVPGTAAQQPSTLQQRLQSGLEQRAGEFADEDIDHRALAGQTLFRVSPGKLLLSRIFDIGTLLLLTIFIGSLIAIILVPEPEAKLIMVSALLAPALFGIIPSIWLGFNKNFGFTVSTAGDEVRIASGLTKTVTETLQIRRIQSVQVSQSLLWRLFGWWKVDYTIPAAATSGEESQQISKVALPVGSREEVQQLLALMLPEMVTAETVSEGMDGTGDWQITPPARGGIINLFNQKRKAATVRAGGAERSPLLLLRSGSVVRWFSIVPLTRVQGLIYRVNLKHAILRLARLDVFSSRINAKSSISGVDPAELQRFIDTLSAELLRAQLSEASPAHNAHGQHGAHEQHSQHGQYAAQADPAHSAQAAQHAMAHGAQPIAGGAAPGNSDEWRSLNGHEQQSW
ncbi:PH domain-containing protein [Leucobacter sp. OH1287]|uniref:PH domain-containing protein n=1 Tax=Leucobacter sp. OH1287 TaxID=2491049 RepID=UPI000F5FF75F|nr:PH domain-containing protein [Leucobacter sp. OH1287]RRD61317.1 hypothetical protein EII30_02635 [Leucobacter sp. OH1287]